MSKEYTEIDERLQRWVEKQPMFFVATAPQDGGHINCSPKGLDSLLVVSPQQLAYADVGGSGIETVAHLKDNGRITIMMCAFDGPPKIYRFYGSGTVIEPHQAEFAELASRFRPLPSLRNIILIDIRRIIDSCGFGVPQLTYEKQRDSFDNYLRDKNEAYLINYRRERNAHSLDGLPGLEVAEMPQMADT